MNDSLTHLHREALAAVHRYAEEAFRKSPFVPGETPVPVAGRVVGPPEAEAIMAAALDGWLTEGRFADRFRQAFAEIAERRHVLVVGSGSQANLLALSAAMSHLHDRPLVPGDEVITPAVAFPTTVNPIYQLGLAPVYVDVELETFNPTLEQIADAIGPSTRGVMAAHCLGNPFDAEGVARLCAEHDLVLIEDCCDALGSTLGGRLVGTFGAAATFSFYPAHHMTMGEGGAVTTEDSTWARALTSLREWGRDCWCPPGVNDACGQRFDGQFGAMPKGYDHKYVFSHLGYNFKVTDMQAALGLAQLERLDGFHARRIHNFDRLHAALDQLADRLILPSTLPGARPSWFGYPFTLRDGDAAERRRLQLYLQDRKIDSRLLLGGNLTRQPAYLGLAHRLHGTLANADRATEASIWVGTYPGLNDEMIDWIAESVIAFFEAG